MSREGVKVGVSSSIFAFTGVSLIGDAVSSERSVLDELSGSLQDLGRILRGLCPPARGCFSAMCGVPFSFSMGMDGYNSIPTTRGVGGGLWGG